MQVKSFAESQILLARGISLTKVSPIGWSWKWGYLAGSPKGWVSGGRAWRRGCVLLPILHKHCAKHRLSLGKLALWSCYMSFLFSSFEEAQGTPHSPSGWLQ